VTEVRGRAWVRIPGESLSNSLQEARTGRKVSKKKKREDKKDIKKAESDSEHAWVAERDKEMAQKTEDYNVSE
jgi:hypothetical protein